MKKIHFDVDTDGFYGAYWKCDDDVTGEERLWTS